MLELDRWKLEGMCVSGQGVCFVSGRFWQLAVFAVIGTLAVAAQAQAAMYYYRQDQPPGAAQPVPKVQTQRAKLSRHGDKSGVAVEKESKPQGPLIISVSIAQQKLRIYDAHGLFAETPVSTGMPGHLTPMGVFSIIQKQKFHRSNIYSGAPMPFMQRITWSGVAMHAGVLPGHPASHGCIRMPMAFAVKMYGWTKMGARVIVTPGDVTPANFSHPLLAALKVVPQPVAVEETKADVVAVRNPEKPAQAGADTAAETKIELRSTVGHVGEIKSTADESHPQSASLQVKTADASGAVPAALSANGSEPAPQRAKVAASKQVSKVATEADVPKSEIDPNAAKHDEVASSGEKPAGEKSAETQAGKIADGDGKPVGTAGDQPSEPEAAANEAPKTSDTAAVTSPVVPPVATNEMPLKADLKSDFAKAAARPTPSFTFKKAGQIAVFVSRKDSKLYIRQDFAPLFELPVTIAPDARPLGTHIFTAQVDGNDANVLHWSAVSLPTPSKAAGRTDEERSSHGRKLASPAPIEAKPVPDNPAEALDRLSLPAEVMARVYEAVSTGGSIIVSDQGIAAGETGEGTDFIVSLR
jgi:lipoprotein-anchoring transpeptidase ErfK/SrfK